MPRRIVLLGATGYTGRLVAEALVRARARPVLAGRSSQNLAALGVELGKGLDTAVADVKQPESLLALLQPGDVLVSTVGPFETLGRSVVEAAIERRVTYLDSCREPTFLRCLFETLGPAAETAGVALVPGCGFEFVVGNLAAWLALEHAGNLATGVEVGYFLNGRIRGASSVGTRASTGAAAVAPHFAWRHGHLLEVPGGDQVRRFPVEGTARVAMSIGGMEHLAIPRLLPSIRDISVYMGGPSSERVARTAARVVAAAGKVPGVPPTVRWATRLPRTKAGPDETERSKMSGFVAATAHDAADRELRTVRLGRVNPYAFTGGFLAWAAMRVAAHEIHATGALGPVEAFGLSSLVEGCVAAGLKAAG